MYTYNKSKQNCITHNGLDYFPSLVLEGMLIDVRFQEMTGVL